MPDPAQLIHLLKLIDDDSPSVRAQLAKQFASYGLQLEEHLARLPEPPTTPQRKVLQALLEDHARVQLRAQWGGWFQIEDDKARLEAALSLLAEFQTGLTYPVKLKNLLDSLATAFRKATPQGDELALAEFLFKEQGLRGERSDYYNPLNSNLVYVIREKRGIPISLVMIYILVARRVELSVEGFSFPGHFLACTRHQGEPMLIDCFEGGRAVSLRDVVKLENGSGEVEMTDDWHATPEVMIARVLRNLHRAYEGVHEPQNAAFVLELLGELEADASARSETRKANRKSLKDEEIVWSDAFTDPPAFAPGQLVRHRRYGYRGVVVEYNLSCQADDGWYQHNRTQPDRNQAWYHVLVHDSAQMTYAAQTNLEADDSRQSVNHPLIDKFFAPFKDGRYERNGVPWPGI